MFDPLLLKNQYPCKAAAFVESGEYTWTLSSGRKAKGRWIGGVASHVEQGALWFLADGEWYKIHHSEQLRCHK
ncbi:hypothetical protein D3C75_927050 [compost metagenome]